MAPRSRPARKRAQADRDRREPAAPGVGPPAAPEVQPAADDPVPERVAGEDPFAGPDPRLLIDFF